MCYSTIAMNDGYVERSLFENKNDEFHLNKDVKDYRDGHSEGESGFFDDSDDNITEQKSEINPEEIFQNDTFITEKDETDVIIHEPEIDARYEDPVVFAKNKEILVKDEDKENRSYSDKVSYSDKENELDSDTVCYFGKRYDVNFECDIPCERKNDEHICVDEEIYPKRSKLKSKKLIKSIINVPTPRTKYYNPLSGNICRGHILKTEHCNCKEDFKKLINVAAAGIEFEKNLEKNIKEKKKIKKKEDFKKFKITEHQTNLDTLAKEKEQMKKNVKSYFIKWYDRLFELPGQVILEVKQSFSSKKKKTKKCHSDQIMQENNNSEANNPELLETDIHIVSNNSPSTSTPNIAINDDDETVEADDFDEKLIGEALYHNLAAELRQCGEIGQIERCSDGHVNAVSVLNLAREKFQNIAAVNPAFFIGFDSNLYFEAYRIENLLNPNFNSIFNYSAENTRIVIFPIVHANHWTLYIYNRNENCLHFYDPLNNMESNAHYNVVQLIVKDLFNVNKIRVQREFIPYSIRQKSTDGINCGIYVCLYMEMYAKYGEITNMQINLSEARNRFDILTRELVEGINATPISMFTNEECRRNSARNTNFQNILTVANDKTFTSNDSENQTQNVQKRNAPISSLGSCSQTENYQSFCRKKKIGNSKKSRLLYKNYCVNISSQNAESNSVCNKILSDATPHVIPYKVNFSTVISSNKSFMKHQNINENDDTNNYVEQCHEILSEITTVTGQENSEILTRCPNQNDIEQVENENTNDVEFLHAVSTTRLHLQNYENFDDSYKELLIDNEANSGLYLRRHYSELPRLDSQSPDRECIETSSHHLTFDANNPVCLESNNTKSQFKNQHLQHEIENFEDFCRRKKIGKRNKKSRELYDKYCLNQSNLGHMNSDSTAKRPVTRKRNIEHTLLQQCEVEGHEITCDNNALKTKRKKQTMDIHSTAKAPSTRKRKFGCTLSQQCEAEEVFNIDEQNNEHILKHEFTRNIDAPATKRRKQAQNTRRHHSDAVPLSIQDDFDENLVTNDIYQQLFNHLVDTGEVGNEELYDSHIFAFSALLLARERYRHIACVNPEFFSNGSEKNQEEGLRLKAEDLFNNELGISWLLNYSAQRSKFILFPIVDKNHWTLYIFDSNKKLLLFFDPYNRLTRCRHRDLVIDICRRLMNVSRIGIRREMVPAIVQQPSEDKTNCGIYVAFYMEMFLKHGMVPEQELSIPEVRRRFDVMCNQLMRREKARAISTDTSSSTRRAILESYEDFDDSYYELITQNGDNVDIDTEYHENILRHKMVRSNNTRRTKGRRQTQNTRQHRNARNIYQQERVYIPKAADYANVQPFDIGYMNFKCSKCGSLHFKHETRKADGCGGHSYFSCCNHGEIKMNLEDNYPQYFKDLLIGNDRRGKLFQKNINKLNKLCSFGHVTGQDCALPGIFNVRIEGLINHLLPRYIRPSETAQNTKPAFGQLYIVPTEVLKNVIEQRLHFERNNEKQLAKEVHDHMKEINIFAQCFLTVAEKEQEELALAEELGVEPRIITLRLFKTTDDPSSNYAPPQAREMAGIFICDENGFVPANDLEIYSRRTVSNRSVREYIRRFSPNVEKLLFSLCYPTGQGDTWYQGKSKKFDLETRRKLTPRQYARYILAIRNLPSEMFNPIILSKELFGHWIIYYWSVIENQIMTWVYTHQKELRIERWQGVMDYIVQHAAINNVEIGRRIILPSTITNTPRWKSEKFHDAMSLVRKYGRPHIFLTMTVNPKHPDLLKNLPPDGKPEHHPNIVNEFFAGQIDHLMYVIKEKRIFGKVVYLIYVVEYQKRGSPHIHLLLRVADVDWKNEKVIDSIIKAEIPEMADDPDLYELVKTQMIHHPCGETYPNAVCMVNKKCKRRFPKDFTDVTVISDESFPSYRRPNNGREIEVNIRGRGMVKVDNSFVVPYVPYLLKMFKSHINVEVVSTLQCVTYLFKYLFKGEDRTMLDISEGVLNYDEVHAYVDTRVICDHEAEWRISERPLFYSTHSIERLPIHLNRQNTVAMNPGADRNEILAALEKPSKLIAFFKYNADHPNGINKTLMYPEFVEHFTWNDSVAEWHPRGSSSKPKVGRPYTASPRETEKFYLRKLLHVVRGPTGYDDLLKHPETQELLPSFYEACLARNLVTDDLMFREALLEAFHHTLPRQFRAFFAYILIFCPVGKPMNLWMEFKNHASADFRRTYSPERAEIMAMRFILKKIMDSEKSISEYPELEELSRLPEYQLEDDPNIVIEHRERGLEMLSTLNIEQKTAFDAIMNNVTNQNSNSTNCYMIEASGGCGKTYLFNCLISTLMGMGKKVKVMAWSGIAAHLYPDGRTCHNVFKLDFPFKEDSNSGIRLQEKAAEELRSATAIFCDEVSMLLKRALEVFDKTLQDIMQNQLPFGGKLFILAGDFKQLPPVVPNGTRADIVRSSVKSSRLWKHFKSNTLVLNINERANNVDNFCKDILDIGTGNANSENETVKLPKQIFTDADLVEEVFGNSIETGEVQNYIKRTILCTLNRQVDQYNERIMNLLDESTERVYTSIDTPEENLESEQIAYNPEYFDGLRKSNFPAHKIRLRKYAVITLMRNLSIEDGLCNGTRLLVTELRENFIKAKKLTNFFENEEDSVVLIPKITLTNDETVFVVRRYQLPVRAAFATTTNKSQGQTYEFVGIDYTSRIFSHGHLYVALSRTRSWEKIRMQVVDEERNATRNIVYKNLITGPFEIVNDENLDENSSQS